MKIKNTASMSIKSVIDPRIHKKSFPHFFFSKKKEADTRMRATRVR